mmetsp:Transcript_15307/g.38866  ORF Transcript_15307/g.38866 Transcript_15307/m.38866 type:complete len:309 (+) Transcript_15307:393-1319(+)
MKEQDDGEGAARGRHDLGAMSGEAQQRGTVCRTPSPSAEATHQILQMLSNEAAEEGHQVGQLLDKVTESITEISANKKPRKRARLRESFDWTEKEVINDEALELEARELMEMEVVGVDAMSNSLAHEREREELIRLAASGYFGEAASAADPNGGNLGTFALNAVVVLARAALKKDGDQHNAKALQATLEKMHAQYSSLANECRNLQEKLRSEKDTCTSLERDVDRTQRDVVHLTSENERLVGKVQSLEMQVRCQICYEARRNCLLMPCLHFCFCSRCMDQHFQSSEARQCPICRNSVSGVVVMQLEQD